MPHLNTALVNPQRPARGQRKRPGYRSDAFFLTILIFAVFALYSYAAADSNANSESVYNTQASVFHRRDSLGPFEASDDECRLVRNVPVDNQCAYINKRCPDEDTGFYSYLSLYYCRLPHAKPAAFILIVVWLGLLFSTIGIAASDFFCVNLSTIAAILGMSESLAGVTFLAFGNGSPDVFSTFAAFTSNSSSLAIGELFGAACFITACVTGSMGIVKPFKVSRKSYMRDVIFFGISAVFSLGFLWDGKLQLWECLAMVGYYLIYVIFVVVWHWYFTQRRRRRERTNAARAQYIAHAAGDHDQDPHPYRDHVDEEAATRPTMSRGPSTENFNLLQGDHLVPAEDDVYEELEDEERVRYLASLQTNMHLSRPRLGSRRNTITPIRPSLVGALEYRAVISSLQKARSHQTIPMFSRRYSDNPDNVPLQPDNVSTLSDPQSRPPYHLSSPRDAHSPLLQRPPHPDNRNTASGRNRAVSANDVSSLRHDSSFFQRNLSRDRLVDISEDENGNLMPPAQVQGYNLPTARAAAPQTPDLVVSEAQDSFADTWQENTRGRSPSLLAPPVGESHSIAVPPSPPRSPFSQSPAPSARQLPKLHIPNETTSTRGSSPASPFPTYNDVWSATGSRPPSICLPPASISVESNTFAQLECPASGDKPLSWWPYAILPPPSTILYRLFPTLDHWRDKSWFDRALTIVALPSIFILTITLPVVHSVREEECAEPGLQSPQYTGETASAATKDLLAFADPEVHSLQTVHGHDAENLHPGHGSAAVAAGIEHRAENNTAAGVQSPPQTPSEASKPLQWDRWLTIVQLFMAPLFMVFVIYTQSMDLTEGPRQLIKPICISLLVSLLLLVALLLTTTPTYRPKQYETIMSLAGFVVSIGWISTIASQVVEVLKALAVIMNMSHAVMGLTIFAVGNSLGDLVANMTCANYGFPIMALSACFGGPMLNILLGIGLSGSYVLIRGAQHRHRKHPGKEIEYRSYKIEVGDTLMVSGFTLVLTLAVLAVAVPCNKWVLGRRIGFGLIALWLVSTTCNVLFIEYLGYGQAVAKANNF